MLLLDTNVLSEFMKDEPDPSVLVYMTFRAEEGVSTTAINTSEIYAGLFPLPRGKRKEGLLGAFSSLLEHEIETVFAFDDQCAEVYGHLHAELLAQGNIVGANDVRIAAIALVNDLTVVTRNVADFVNTGVRLENPFTFG